MLENDIRSARRLADLIREIRDGAMLRARRRTRRPFEGAAIVRTLYPDRTVKEDWVAFPNMATTAGLNAALETVFRGGTQYGTWYCGLIDNSGYTAVAVGDTMSSHAGWAEYTAITNANRVTWSPAAAASGSVINATAMSFTNDTGAGNIIGIFVCTNNTLGGTTGTLWATAVEGSARALAASEVFQAYYEVDLAPQA